MWRFLVVSLVLLLIEIIVIVALVSPQRINATIQQEQIAFQNWFGQNKTKDMIIASNTTFDFLFVETGIAEEFNSWFYHDTSKRYRNQGIQTLNESSFFSGFYSRLEQFWLVIRFSFLRAQMIWVCLILALTFIIPAIIDGLMIRQVQRYGDENVSLNLYQFAEYTFYSCLIFPLYIMFSPITISPLYMVPYCLVLACSVWVLAANVQHRI
jgi:hypothetical protein